MKIAGGGHKDYPLWKEWVLTVDWGWDFSWVWAGFEFIFWRKEQLSLDLKLGFIRGGLCAYNTADTEEGR